MATTFTLPAGDDGRIRIKDPTSGAEATLDLYEASNTYAGLSERFDDPVQLAAEWCGWLAAQGLGGLSHGQAFHVADAVTAATAEFKKKGPSSPTPD